MGLALTDRQFTLPRDTRGDVIQSSDADSVEKVDCTTTAWAQVQVPRDAIGAVVWAVADGAATTIAFIYGGAGFGAPATGATVPTSQQIAVRCGRAPFLYFKATGAACDVMIQWIRRDF